MPFSIMRFYFACKQNNRSIYYSNNLFVDGQSQLGRDEDITSASCESLTVCHHNSGQHISI